MYWGDLETDEKRNLSERLSKFLFVRGGGLEVLPFADKSRFMNGVKAKQSADPQTGDGELLCDREREIEGVFASPRRTPRRSTRGAGGR